jgi:hypothetical protein
LIHSPLSEVFLGIIRGTLLVEDFSIKLGDAIIVSIAYICLAASTESITVFIAKAQDKIIFLSFLLLLVNLEDCVRSGDVISVSQENICHFFKLWGSCIQINKPVMSVLHN